MKIKKQHKIKRSNTICQMAIDRIKKADSWWEGRKFKHPETNNVVRFKSLPGDEQRRLTELVIKQKEIEQELGKSTSEEKPIKNKIEKMIEKDHEAISKGFEKSINEKMFDGMLSGKSREIVKKFSKAFVGPFLFGFMDNCLMYVAGASLDKALVGMGLGASALAGLGNTISDTVGKGVEESVDNLLDKVGFGESKGGKLSPGAEKAVKYFGSISGIALGALAGMVPMLFGVRLGKKADKLFCMSTKRLEDLGKMTDIQCSNGNWNYDPYMHGMANGMILALATILEEEPCFKEAPEKWLDKHSRLSEKEGKPSLSNIMEVMEKEVGREKFKQFLVDIVMSFSKIADDYLQSNAIKFVNNKYVNVAKKFIEDGVEDIDNLRKKVYYYIKGENK